MAKAVASIDVVAEKIYGMVLSPEATGEALEAICDALVADAGSLLRISPDGGLLKMHAFNHDAAAQQDYSTYYHRLDPGLVLVRNVGVGRVAMDEMLFDERNPAQGEYVHDFCYRHGIRWVLGAKVAEDADGLTCISLQRRAGRHAFRSDDGPVRAQLMAHLQQASLIASSLESLRRENAILTEALHAFGSAALVVTGRGTVRHANRSAELLVGAGSACRLRMGQLAWTSPGADHRLAGAIRAACRKPARASSLRLPGSGGELLVRVVPVPVSAASGFAWPELLALVVIADPQSRHPAPETIAELFGLTSAESRLVSALSRGQSLEHIAAATGVSKNTLRTQLASAFGKTGTASQAQLVSLARTVPDLATDH